MEKYDNRLEIESEFPCKIGVLVLKSGRDSDDLPDVMEMEYGLPDFTTQTFGRSTTNIGEPQEFAEQSTKRVVGRLRKMKDQINDCIQHFESELGSLKKDKPLSKGQQEMEL